MTRRMIDSSMWSNENFAALPAMARLLQIGIINHADDQGRVKANPLYLSKEIFPYDRVSPTNITKWLELMENNGTITLYTIEGKQYAQLTKWWDYQSLQYAAPSEYPAPPNWKDRIRRTSTKGQIVTYNWTLTNGAEVDDTCDEHGKPLTPKAKLPSTPPPSTKGTSHSPVDSPEYPPERTIELNLIEDQKKGERCARDEYTIQSRDGEYIPGVPLPHYNQVKRNCDHFTAEARRHGIGPEPFRLMVDAVLDATGKSALANTSGERGQRVLNEAKQTVLELAEMGRKTIEDVAAVLDSWRKDDYRGGSSPSFGQIVDHASAMAAGTHVTKRQPQDTAKKEFMSMADYNEWAARNDPQYKRIREGILVKGNLIKRDNYQPARAH